MTGHHSRHVQSSLLLLQARRLLDRLVAVDCVAARTRVLVGTPAKDAVGGKAAQRAAAGAGVGAQALGRYNNIRTGPWALKIRGFSSIAGAYIAVARKGQSVTMRQMESATFCIAI